MNALAGNRETVDSIGPFKGNISGAYDTPALREALAALPDRLAAGAVVHDGRNRLVRCRLRAGNHDLDLAVKAFGAPSPLSRLAAVHRLPKAHRAWAAARRLFDAGGLTPEPVAWLVRTDGAPESYFLTRFSEETVSFREALNTLYREHPKCDALMALLQTVADAVRRMHEAGLFHRDLGNQNILLRRKGAVAWGDPQIIDLNRARLGQAPTVRERARDLSRITLPSDFLRIFFQMYHGGPAPESFLRWERHYRARFAWHTRTRAFRHPIRERKTPRDPLYPAPRDIWIWDERSGQAISAWTARDRRRLYPHTTYLGVSLKLLQSIPDARRAYRRNLTSAFERPVPMPHRIGVAVQGRPETEERETRLLQELGTPPVLVRLYHHETESDWAYTADVVRRLHGAGHRVSIALVQDRRAVLDPARWRAFLFGVLNRVHDVVEAVEIGHAVNRVKWGLWSPAEYRTLMEPAAEWMHRYPALDWLGPAGIDAEFPRILALLHALPDGVRFTALSQHLYVDRRGAPENRQGRMATLEKMAAARAIATASGRCGDRLVVSEVNWPLADTGVYSPVCSPYMYPGQVVGAPNVEEAAAADYLLRYVLIALCSGLAERVFWWRLAAHGYGLVDDRGAGGWRVRPAFRALSLFLQTSGAGRFLRTLPAPPGAYAWLFETGAQGHVWAYAHPEPVSYRPPFSYTGLCDAQGRTIEKAGDTVRLSGTPVLFSGVPPDSGLEPDPREGASTGTVKTEQPPTEAPPCR